MRQIQELSVEQRSGTGKGPAYRARLKGLIPAVVYGGEARARDPSRLTPQVWSAMSDGGSFLTTLFMLDVGGKKTRVIPRAVQLDPVSDRRVHVDFMRLAEGATVRLAIPVRFKGQENSPGLKRGGVLNIVRHEVELICPADNIPDYIEGDLSGMDIHDSLHISAFKLPEGVKPVIRDRDFTVARSWRRPASSKNRRPLQLPPPPPPPRRLSRKALCPPKALPHLARLVPRLPLAPHPPLAPRRRPRKRPRRSKSRAQGVRPQAGFRPDRGAAPMTKMYDPSC